MPLSASCYCKNHYDNTPTVTPSHQSSNPTPPIMTSLPPLLYSIHRTPHSPLAKLPSTTLPPCTASVLLLSPSPSPSPSPILNPNAQPLHAACRTCSLCSARCWPRRWDAGADGLGLVASLVGEENREDGVAGLEENKGAVMEGERKCESEKKGGGWGRWMRTPATSSLSLCLSSTLRLRSLGFHTHYLS